LTFFNTNTIRSYISKININFILIEIAKEIQLYYEKNEMKINEKYSYRTLFIIITTEPGIYSIKYYKYREVYM
jgi:hypothetical protein